MPGLVPGIHVLRASGLSVDGRDKPGHDAVETPVPRYPSRRGSPRVPTAPHRFAADAQLPRVTTGQRG
ncbi:hypothetical protein ACVWYQ_005470 [Bradyrhizobium sp. USDA 3397]